MFLIYCLVLNLVKDFQQSAPNGTQGLRHSHIFMQTSKKNKIHSLQRASSVIQYVAREVSSK